MSRFLAPRYFAESYFGTVDACQERGMVFGLSNDFDALTRIETLLRESGEFALVAFPERSSRANPPAQLTPSVGIVPVSWRESDDANPDVVLRVVQFDLVLTVRSVDVRAGVQRLFRLATIAQNRLDGSDLGGQTLQGRTRVSIGVLDQNSTSPELKLTLRGEFAYGFLRSNGRH